MNNLSQFVHNVHLSGNFDSSFKLLIMNVKGEAMYSAIGLIRQNGMLLYPVEQSFRSDLRLEYVRACYFLYFETAMAICK